MRVSLLLEQALAPVPGGTGRYARELTAALARTAGEEDSVAGWTAWHRDLSAAGLAEVAIRRLPLPRRALTLAWEREVGPVPSGADLVHAPTLLLPPRVTPLVVTIHDAVPWTDPDTLTPRGVRWHRRMAQLAARRAAAIAVPTQAVADELTNVLAGLSSERISVLGAGVSAELCNEPSEAKTAEVQQRYRLPERFVLSLATLEPRKGLDVLIRSLAQLGGAAPALVLVGQPGWGGIDPQVEAVRHGMGPAAVQVLGKVPDADLGVILRQASMLAVPSRAEGFGLPVAEAMAVGTPVICSDVPALVEVAGGSAVVVPRGDAPALAGAIEYLAGNPAERGRLSAAGRVRAAAFDWDEVARRAWALYRRVV
jgi:glycosyltransferase involved in cell wall biosynthesis